MDTNYLPDDEFIDVESYSDSEQISQHVAEKTIVPVEKYDEKSMGSKSKCALLQTDQKSIGSSHNNKTTPNSTNINKKDDVCDILFGIMNRMFSARVVLKRLPNPPVKKIEPAKKHNTRNGNRRSFEEKSGRTTDKKSFVVKETAFIHEGTAYVRKCPKCEMPPAVRKTKSCLSCKIDLIYECQKCHKRFTNYKAVLAHLDSKCFIKGYYHCSVCDYKTITLAQVKSHMLRLHLSVQFNKETLKWTDAKMFSIHECSQCGKKFDSHEFLNKHIQICSKAQVNIKLVNSNKQVQFNSDFQKMIIRFCPKCNKDIKVYDCGVSSLQPCQTCGAAMKFKCSQCSKKYEDYSGCSYHTRSGCKPPRKRNLHPRYDSGSNIYCPHCNQPFLQGTWLKKHLSKCQVLDRKPREPVAFKHLKATCNNCDQVQNIPERRKMCAQCKSGLHFQCKTCDKQFTADNWCKHLKDYFDRVKYECNDCGVGLISRKTMLNHLKICNCESLHCDLCDFTTKIKTNMYRHILFQHPVLKS